MPLYRSMITEQLAQFEHSQHRDVRGMPMCADYELNAAECWEAYGYFRGQRMCKDYFDDWDECCRGNRQHHRENLILLEKLKQVGKGERKLTFDGFWGKLPNPEGSGGYAVRP